MDREGLFCYAFQRVKVTMWHTTNARQHVLVCHVLEYVVTQSTQA